MYLMFQCQEGLQRVWVAKETVARTAAAKGNDDKVIKTASEKKGKDESELYSEEYYTAQKAKRQSLGLIKFISELFKLQMLTKHIMHECVKKLLANVENPEEEEIESLCLLLRTVGQLLDVPKARAHMDVYFSRMKELCKSTNVSSRMQFMLQVVAFVLLLLLSLLCRQDVIELREQKWKLPNVVNTPTSLAQVHEAVCIPVFFFARVFLSLISADRERHSFAKFYLGPAPSDSAPSASDDKVQSPRCLEAEKQRIDEHVKMFFATCNLDQAEMDSDKLFYPHLPQAPWSTSYRFHFICISHITHEGLFHCTVPRKSSK